MTTLVTGAAGFIGFHLADRLMSRGERVVGIDNFNAYYDPQLKEDRVAELRRRHGELLTLHRIDFADHEALAAALKDHAFERIAHLGAQAGVRYSLENPRAYVQANVVGHLNLLEVARERQVPMVYASSSSVYGGNDKLPFSEEDRVDHPVSLYAATKKADELMSETYAHLYRIPLTGLRFFTVYGPWGRPDMAPWLFTEAILTGKPIKLFNNGDMRRDFTYIDDIIDGVVAALDHSSGAGARHRIYNIGNSRSEQLERFVQLIETACERPAVRQPLPMQPGDVRDTYADVSAIARDLGYAPRTSLDAGIPEFVRWYRAYKEL
ncbi:NAD-dependent epimerase/dehydratase family protein [Sphingomonas sp. ID1715]|uniref:NAD-dependent epimerase/dehydratase family protein n=1 Tax=Sphingomonas sp. ID1715 TaxID=1656898 RepID=UPI001487BA65|nr:NAD-dependent epimerase/dehydratase family protein [Sphingomonas sp. ID1715]NNM75624.1 NAD-dependent epimerase/dehydratase family protein [Sphingomonas sp. ID1715]